MSTYLSDFLLKGLDFSNIKSRPDFDRLCHLRDYRRVKLYEPLRMNTELLKTFLEVERTRHFGKAAHNLFLTQTAVSARIRLLEQTLGVALFSRARNNIQLTQQGERLLPHARKILHSWNHALAELSITQERTPRLLRVGGLPTLWEAVLQEWLGRLYQQKPEIIVQAEVLPREILLRKLADGLLDMIVLTEPVQTVGSEGFASQVVCHLSLRMMASCEYQTVMNLCVPYIQIDWGVDFQSFHQHRFASLNVAMQCNQGSIALHFIEQYGGAAYLACVLSHRLEAAGHLFPVTDAPHFHQQVIVFYSVQNERINVVEETIRYFHAAQ